MNATFRTAGLPVPSLFLRQHGIKPYVDVALDNLGVKEYMDYTYPVNGYEVNITVRDNGLWQLIQKNEFETECFNHLSHILRKGMKVMDVGAGFGIYTLLFSVLLGDEGRVYAFEPDPVSSKILYDNVRKNRLRNVSIDNRCLSNNSGYTILKSRRWGTGNSTMMDYLDKYAPLQIRVPTTTIDNFCREERFVPDGIKIDVEGAEGLVLEGARTVIEKHAPWVLMEFHGGVMSNMTRNKSWRLATESAKEILFLDDKSNFNPPGDKLDSILDRGFFHVFIRY